MSLLTTLASFQTPLTILFVIFGPSLLPKAIALLRPPPQPQSQHVRSPALPPARCSTTLKLLLAAHTLWLVSHLVKPPYNLFTSNQLPILTSNAQLRSALLRNSGSPASDHTGIGDLEAVFPNIHPLLELLLTKLKVLENRYLYARYGHFALQDCVWCQTSLDYLLFSIPSVVTWYLLEAVFIGALGFDALWKDEAVTPRLNGQTMGMGMGMDKGAPSEASRRALRWRSLAGWSLFGAAMAELGVKYGWEVRAVEGDCVHLASTTHTLRTVFLLLLPFIYIYLPVPSASPNISPDTLLPTISNTTSVLRLTSLARKGIQRSRLRENWAMIGKREGEVSEMLKRDEGVKAAVKDAGLDQEALRSGFRAWVADGWRGMVRVDERARDGNGNSDQAPSPG
ncbi:hypothetical protein IAU59_004867 [Kwoniella sp. CBS 9459]